MASISPIQLTWIAMQLDNNAERYLKSNKVVDIEYGKTLQAIADDLRTKKLESAQVRFSALHPNIKSSLPFQVLDVLNGLEHYNRK